MARLYHVGYNGSMCAGFGIVKYDLYKFALNKGQEMGKPMYRTTITIVLLTFVSLTVFTLFPRQAEAVRCQEIDSTGKKSCS